ncbi:MAG: VTT domain-containing protein [Phycisphaerales bacterium]|jgi:uncharacterized membrane protein YdjX (TVP38/TMEM64 family)|nr:VTT domain-containing protein [Phycisphaerales bacterium]MBT7171053.1 VTT domain-containing protein [Phycisphaerales bacterium]
MSFSTKITLVCLGFVGVSVTLFLIFGDWFEDQLSEEKMKTWIDGARNWAWIAAIVLMMSDLVLPIPATPIMAALGIVYGPWVGGLVAAAGATMAALFGYSIARWAESAWLEKIADSDEIERFQHFYDNWGGATIILTRSLPILPEVMAVLAGLAKMHIGRFLVAVLIGAIPTGLFMAWVGHASRGDTTAALIVVTIIPVLLWPIYLLIVKRFSPNPSPKPAASIEVASE